MRGSSCALDEPSSPRGDQDRDVLRATPRPGGAGGASPPVGTAVEVSGAAVHSRALVGRDRGARRADAHGGGVRPGARRDRGAVGRRAGRPRGAAPQRARDGGMQAPGSAPAGRSVHRSHGAIMSLGHLVFATNPCAKLLATEAEWVGAFPSVTFEDGSVAHVPRRGGAPAGRAGAPFDRTGRPCPVWAHPLARTETRLPRRGLRSSSRVRCRGLAGRARAAGVLRVQPGGRLHSTWPDLAPRGPRSRGASRGTGSASTAPIRFTACGPSTSPSGLGCSSSMDGRGVAVGCVTM